MLVRRHPAQPFWSTARVIEEFARTIALRGHPQISHGRRSRHAIRGTAGMVGLPTESARASN
jgi:hypothetical protein